MSRLALSCLAIVGLFWMSGASVWATASPSPSVAAPTPDYQYKTYTNVRYLFQVDYPPELLRAQGESANSDGQKFQSQDGLAELRVYGSYNSLGDSLRNRYETLLNTPGLKVGSKVLTRYYYQIEGTIDAGKVHFLEKTYYRQQAFKTLQWVYPTQQKKLYIPVQQRILNSFEEVVPAS